MDHRVEDGKVPTKVVKLMRQEEARGFDTEEPLHTDKWSHLRASYCEMLEEYLDDLGKRQHWGKPLKWKMKKFSSEAYVVLKNWANLYGIQLAIEDSDNDSVEEYANKLKEYADDEHFMLAGERLFDNSPYGILLRTLDRL